MGSVNSGTPCICDLMIVTYNFTFLYFLSSPFNPSSISLLIALQEHSHDPPVEDLHEQNPGGQKVADDQEEKHPAEVLQGEGVLALDRPEQYVHAQGGPKVTPHVWFSDVNCAACVVLARYSMTNRMGRDFWPTLY